jgi:threonine-phosphate decarboxylase
MADPVDVRLAHGGAVAQAARELGRAPGEILDFSASINPLGMPKEVLEAAREAMTHAVHYPEIDASSLVTALAAAHGLPAEHFLPGSGSTELLYLFSRVLRPRRAMLVAPAFSEYERSLSQVGAAIDIFPLSADNGFHLDPCLLVQHLHPETDLVLLANPGNPTGAGIDPHVVETIARAVREQALVAVDEAFVDFCLQRSVLGAVGLHSNLYVFRSLTKFYAIPGLRAGYLAGPAAGIARLRAAKEPWTLSVPALVAAETCLGQEDYRQRTLETIPALRKDLTRGLEDLGMTVFPSEANFLLARLEEGEPPAPRLAAELRGMGILIRDCSNFPSLDERYVRVAVRTQEENARLLQALSGVLQKDERSESKAGSF